MRPAPSRTRDFSAIIIRIAILLYPCYFALDWFIYPERKLLMLAVRIGVSAILMAVQFLYPKVRADRRPILLYFGFLVCSLGISFLCLIGGEGFQSPYYMGILQVVMISSFFQDIPKRDYAFLLSTMLGLHFLLLFLVPWTWNGLLLNLFGLAVFSGVALFTHNLLLDLARENRELKEILPICAHCKRIRDDAGYWKEVEFYIKAHAGVELSHGLCPQCVRELYPQIADEMEGKPKGSR